MEFPSVTRPNLIRLEARADTMIVSHSRTVWVGDHDGMLDKADLHGCYAHETRLLSKLRWRLNEGLYAVESSPVKQNSFLAYLIAAPRRRHASYRSGSADQGARNSTEQTIGLRLSTVLTDGFHQDADIENFTLLEQRIDLEIEFDADFADYDEVSRQQRQQRGRLRRRREPTSGGEAVIWEYQARHRGHTIDRGSRLEFCGLPEKTRWSDGRLRAQLRLAPGERHHLCLTLGGHIEHLVLQPDPGCYEFSASDPRQRQYETEGARISEVSPEPDRLRHSLARAREDLAALYMRDLDRTEGAVTAHQPTAAPRGDHAGPAWVPAAGIPSYISVFGRDDLTAGWQSALFGPELLRGALRLLRETQGTHEDDWRDEMPGRILHEAHTGPLSVLDYRPQGRYYGSMDSSPFYVICLSEYYHWTGDRATTLELLPAARAALGWMERYGHPGPPHFYSYKTRSSQGVANQGWKDSSDAIVDPEARVIQAPIAACSIQGYAYEAKLRMAELEWLDGNHATAARLLWQAHELKQRFNNVFWVPEQKYFAMALDHRGRRVESVASDPGDALASGIVDAQHAPHVAGRLLHAEMFSGWGIRTLSARHKAFNPFSYHRGSVWPVENAVIGAGLRRYGFVAEMAQLLRAQLEVAAWFQHRRLPEVFSGHQRDHEHPFPAVYPKANSPQAWSAGVMPLWVQMLVGLYPYAPMETAFLDPALPPWLPELRIDDIRVGAARLSLRLKRLENGQTEFEPVHLTGRLRLVRQPSPWSLFASTRERLRDLLDAWAA